MAANRTDDPPWAGAERDNWVLWQRRKHVTMAPMHELAITENILSIAVRQAEQHGARRLTAIKLVVGDLTGYVPDSMQFYFSVLSKGTLAEEAELIIKRTPTKVRCRACQIEFAPAAGLLWVCPACEAIGGDVMSGKELLVESIEIE